MFKLWERIFKGNIEKAVDEALTPALDKAIATAYERGLSDGLKNGMITGLRYSIGLVKTKPKEEVLVFLDGMKKAAERGELN